MASTQLCITSAATREPWVPIGILQITTGNRTVGV